MKPLVAIIDYGMGNLRSVQKALEKAGADARITDSPGLLSRAAGIVLPGVGAFGEAVLRLKSQHLWAPLNRVLASKRPFLGICLGYQLLFDESTEGGRHEGLGLLPGRVVRVQGTEHLPVIGWSRLKQTARSPLWDGIADESYFYFVHSYAPDSSESAIACAPHSPAAAAARGNVMGTQFHPEKSGVDGLRIYRNFVAMSA